MPECPIAAGQHNHLHPLRDFIEDIDHQIQPGIVRIGERVVQDQGNGQQAPACIQRADLQARGLTGSIRNGWLDDINGRQVTRGVDRSQGFPLEA